jgi:hypothetical protein
MFRYEANGSYIDNRQHNVEQFSNTETPTVLSNYINMLKSITPAQSHEMKNQLQLVLRDIANRLDNFNQEQTHEIVQKLSVILSNVNVLMNNIEPNINNIIKLLTELGSGIYMLLSQQPK